MIHLSQKAKQKILEKLEESYPTDLSIGEIAKKTGLSGTIVSTYLKVLVAEGKIIHTRNVGRTVFYRAKGGI